jgi:hypothetical protein
MPNSLHITVTIVTHKLSWVMSADIEASHEKDEKNELQREKNGANYSMRVNKMDAFNFS